MGPTAVSTSSTEAAAASARVPVGRVVGAHGMRGQIRVQCFTDTPDAIAALAQLWLHPDASQRDGCAYRIESCAPGRSGELRIALAGVSDREAAEALIGRTVSAAIAELPPAGDDEVYGFELLEFRVETAEGRALGRVRGIWSTGGPPLLVIAGEGGAEHLVPSALLLRIERAERRLVVDAIPGLFDDPA